MLHPRGIAPAAVQKCPETPPATIIELDRLPKQTPTLYNPRSRDRNLGRCLGLCDDPQRSGNPRAQDGLNRRRASAPQPGRILAEQARDHRDRRTDAREHQLQCSSCRRLSDDAARGKQIARSLVTGFPRRETVGGRCSRGGQARRPGLAPRAASRRSPPRSCRPRRSSARE